MDRTARRSVVVTGASTGIGWATTKVLTGYGLQVFGSVRNRADAERLKAQFGALATPLVFDVTDETAAREAAALVRDALQGHRLFGLVNNAGVALPGPLLHQPIAEFRRQIEVNLVGALIVTQAFGPLLGVDRTLAGPPGRIVNISSVAGRNGAPFVGGYAASKHGLEGMSESLRRELLLYGIEVIVIGPGAVATPIWDKAEAVTTGPYETTDYATAISRLRKYLVEEGRKGLPPERIGEAIWTALTAARPRLRYAVVPERLKNWTIPQLLPRRLVDRIIGRRLGFTGPRS